MTPHNLAFLAVAWVIDDQFEVKAIQLRLRQRVCPLLLDGVLSGDHHKFIAQRIRLPVDGHQPLIHRLQKRGLRFRGRAVDLVRQQDLRKNRPRCEDKGIRLKIKEVCPQNIARHHIRRKLNAPKLQVETRSKRLNQKRLAGAGSALQKDVAAAQETGEHELKSLVMPHNHFADLSSDVFYDCADELQIHLIILPSNSK